MKILVAIASIASISCSATVLTALEPMSMAFQTQQTITLEIQDRSPIVITLPMSEQAFLELLERERIEFRQRNPYNFPLTDPPSIGENASAAYSFVGSRSSRTVVIYIAFINQGQVVHIKREDSNIKY